MKHIELGKNIKQTQGFKAFIPHPFPPKEGFDFDSRLLKKVDQATRLLGKLDGITKLLPDADFFLLMYLRKDAASSSQIEGTQATMIDAIEAEAKVNANIPKDVDDILHYIKALNYGMNFGSDSFVFTVNLADRVALTADFRTEIHSYNTILEVGDSGPISDIVQAGTWTVADSSAAPLGADTVVILNDNASALKSLPGI